MNSIEDLLGFERHALFLCSMGFRPENAEKHKKRIAELEAEREQQFKDYCHALKLVAKRLCREGEAPPHWVRPMGYDNWIDHKRRLRTQEYPVGHH